MATTSETITKCLTGVCDIKRVYDAYQKKLQAESKGKDGIWEKASLINEAVCLIFTVGDVVMLASGQKAHSIQVLKFFGFFARGMSIIPGALVSSCDLIDQPTDQPIVGKIIRLVEKDLLSPIADTARIGAELSALGEKHFLEMSPEELKDAKIPIYEWKGGGLDGYSEIVGYKPVDLDECKSNLKSWETAALVSSTVRTVAEFNTLSSLGSLCYDSLYKYLHPNLDLLSRDAIPLMLQNDEVFSKYKCPITERPIRYPVIITGDEDTTYYERSAITEWINNYGTHPQHFTPLTVDQLEDAVIEANEINNRLSHYEENLAEWVKNRTREITRRN